jgi:hypothetical protein
VLSWFGAITLRRNGRLCREPWKPRKRVVFTVYRPGATDASYSAWREWFCGSTTTKGAHGSKTSEALQNVIISQAFCAMGPTRSPAIPSVAAAENVLAAAGAELSAPFGAVCLFRPPFYEKRAPAPG